MGPTESHSIDAHFVSDKWNSCVSPYLKSSTVWSIFSLFNFLVPTLFITPIAIAFVQQMEQVEQKVYFLLVSGNIPLVNDMSAFEQNANCIFNATCFDYIESNYKRNDWLWHGNCKIRRVMEHADFMLRMTLSIRCWHNAELWDFLPVSLLTSKKLWKMNLKHFALAWPLT